MKITELKKLIKESVKLALNDKNLSENKGPQEILKSESMTVKEIVNAWHEWLEHNSEDESNLRAFKTFADEVFDISNAKDTGLNLYALKTKDNFYLCHVLDSGLEIDSNSVDEFKDFLKKVKSAPANLLLPYGMEMKDNFLLGIPVHYSFKPVDKSLRDYNNAVVEAGLDELSDEYEYFIHGGPDGDLSLKSFSLLHNTYEYLITENDSTPTVGHKAFYNNKISKKIPVFFDFYKYP